MTAGRNAVVGLVIVVLLGALAACTRSSDVDPSTVDLSGVMSFGFDRCVELTEARTQLLTAKDAASAQSAADALRQFSPPAGVAEAIAVQEAAAGRVTELGSERGQWAFAVVARWVAKACPTVAAS